MILHISRNNSGPSGWCDVSLPFFSITGMLAGSGKPTEYCVSRKLQLCRIRTCSSDTALDQLDGSDVKAQSLKHQAGYPNRPAQQAAGNGSVLATPPRKHVSRSTSDPPERRADNTAKLAATRHANSAHIAQVWSGTCWVNGSAETPHYAAAVLSMLNCLFSLFRSS